MEVANQYIPIKQSICDSSLSGKHMTMPSQSEPAAPPTSPNPPQTNRRPHDNANRPDHWIQNLAPLPG